MTHHNSPMVWRLVRHRLGRRSRTKAVLALSSTLLLLSLILAYLGHDLLRRSAREIDQKILEDTATHFYRGVLGGTTDYLMHKVGDWSIWDPTVTFVHERNPDYIADNLTPQLFIESHVGLVAFFDLQGQVVYARGFDVERKQERVVPARFDGLFTKTTLQPLLHGDQDGLGGLVVMDRQLWLVALRPIRSPDNPRIHGAMLMGQLLDAPGIAYLGRTWDQPFSLEILPEIHAAWPQVSHDLTAGFGCGRQAFMPQGLVMRCMVDDLFGRPTALLTISRPALADSLVHQTRNLYLAGLAICILLFALSTTWLLHQLVFRRLERLRGAVRRLGEQQDLDQRLAFRGHDEFAQLSMAVNAMLDALSQSRQIVAREQQLQRLFHKTHEANFIVEQGVIVLCNRAFAELFGHETPEALTGKPAHTLLAEPDAVFLACREQGLVKGDELELNELTFTRADGQRRTVRARLFFRGAEARSAAEISIEGFLLDITAQEEQSRYYRQLFDLASEAIIVFDPQGFVYDVNQEACELTGLSRETIMQDGFPWERCLGAEDRRRMQIAITQLLGQESDSEQETVRLEATLINQDGSTWPVLASYTKLQRRFDWDKDRLLVVMTDIRALKALEAELRTMSFQDGLTDLYNRRFFDQTLEMTCERRRGMVGLILCDVNYLKLVNDTMGHAAGDALLQRTARLLREACRPADLCARTGGDEFCILLQDAAEQDVQGLLERLKKAMAKESQLLQPGGDVVPFSLAMGAAWSSTPCSPQALLEQADQAMYRDKVLRKQQDREEGFLGLDPRAGPAQPSSHHQPGGLAPSRRHKNQAS